MPYHGFRRFADGEAVGDVIPVFDPASARYHLFILAAPLGALVYPERLHTPWRHLVSYDLTDWTELDVALRPGAPGSVDSEGIWTGSVIVSDGGWHAFYTGVTPGGQQVICRATSADGTVWTKHTNNPISTSNLSHYDPVAWRDPFITRDRDGYRMLLTTRTEGPHGRGAVVEQTSTDLNTWTPAKTVHQPFLVHAPECPETFTIDGIPLLGFSTYTDLPGTVYQMGATGTGPWGGQVSRPDGPYFYAAKGLTDRTGRRLTFGWIPDRDPQPTNPANPWLWGGDLALPRELHLAGRRVTTRPARELTSLIGPRVDASNSHQSGFFDHQEVDSDTEQTFGTLRSDQTLDHYVVKATFAPDTTATVVGIVVAVDDDGSNGLAVLIDRIDASSSSQ